jgi:hypothetical protein
MKLCRVKEIYDFRVIKAAIRHDFIAVKDAIRQDFIDVKAVTNPPTFC